jgi:hypothetical protein
MCDKDPTCECPGPHSEYVASLLNMALEQAEYEGRDMEGAEDFADLLSKAVERRYNRFTEKWK